MGCPVKYFQGGVTIGLTFDEPVKEATAPTPVVEVVATTEEEKKPVKRAKKK